MIGEYQHNIIEGQMITEQVNEDQEKERQADQKRKNLAREQQQALLLANAALIQSQK